MVKRNENLAKLKAGYLFPEINRRKEVFLRENPDAQLISLGIGNTTEPLTPCITESLSRAAAALGTRSGYSGYGEEQGRRDLREQIASAYYGGLVPAEEIFVSDGSKCDIGRLQVLFGAGATIAVQDPSYPVYVDGSVMLGQTGGLREDSSQFEGIEYLSCTPENDFFPDLNSVGRTDVIYFCSPNNPTGSPATRAQLEELVRFARANKAVIIYDAAYALFIKDKDLPRSIFEIEGAREAAIEVNSFSKSAGFTGVRLGWSVVPRDLRFEDGTRIWSDWLRVNSTIFNCASNIVQAGGLAALSESGWNEMRSLVSFYSENAAIIRGTLTDLGYEIYGGVHAPYIWCRFDGQNSWSAFETILQRAQIVTTPGSGFGPAGEGFLRFSGFGSRSDIVEAAERLKRL